MSVQLTPTLLAVFVFLFALGARADIQKSPNDQRDYRSLTLNNSLEVMLISDPQTDKASAAMDVAVGSADDPQAYQGLAHFLEHMLFLGTEQFPDPDAYQRFISEHGGHHNAFTSLEHTNYFFDIAPPHLSAALERFAGQFISPLFNPEYVKREVNAVHSEFTSKLQDDGRRLYSALKQVIAEDHPYRNFSVGNLTTLQASNETALREAMLGFYKQHYAAGNMKLVVLGRESLEELEQLVRKYFTAIPHFSSAKKTQRPPLFSADSLPTKIEVKSIRDKRMLMLGFPVPSSYHHPQAKPTSYLANLIGHEGEGSLLASLKAQGLVDSLSAGSQFDTKSQEIMTISMGLTQEGLNRAEAIVEEIFAYIQRLRKEGIQKLYFDEQSRMLDVSFQFQEKAEAIHVTSALANALHDYPANRVLVTAYDMSDFDAGLYRHYLSYLVPENMLMVVQSNNIESDILSPWYEAPYRVSEIDKKWLAELKSTAPSSQHAMPAPNPFIPDSLEMITTQDQPTPEQLSKREGLELWHQSYTAFNTPKSNLFVSLRSPAAMASPQAQNLSELLTGMFRDALSTFSYPAYLAGLNYDLYNHLRGATLKVSGYSDKQVILLSRLLSTMKHAKLNPARFEILKEKLARKLANASKAKPFEQAFASLQTLLLKPSYSEEERLAALATLSFKDLQDFRRNFFAQLDVVMLSSGNISRSASLNALAQLDAILLKGIQAEKVSRALVQKTNSSPASAGLKQVEHSDTGMVMYLQGNNRSFEEQASMQLLAQIAAPDFYNELRTEKQLGYIVIATYMPLMEVPGLVFAIQSPNADSTVLLSETTNFINALSQRIDEMDEATFERNRSALISKLSREHKTLYQLSNYNWQEIDRLNTRFDTRLSMISALKEMDKTNLLALLKRLNAEQPINKVAFIASAQNELSIEGWQSVEALKQEAPAYFSEY